MKSWLYSKIRAAAPNTFFGKKTSDLLLQHIKPVNYMDHWSIQPFNGQIVRHSTIAKIIDDFKPNYCIETGTYLGSTTAYLAGYSTAPTFTIEIDRTTADKTIERHRRNYPGLDIRQIIGDSAVEIENVLKGISPADNQILAYLDAHWLDAIPTKTELMKLVEWGGDWVAVVDDFQVPNDDGYSFDQYGDVIIGKNEVPRNLGIRTFVPAVSSSYETGARRGTGYLFFGNSLQKLSSASLKLIKEI